jgi:hypothetical protein
VGGRTPATGRFVEHNGGHVIPDDPAITTRIADFVGRGATVKSSE